LGPRYQIFYTLLSESSLNKFRITPGRSYNEKEDKGIQLYKKMKEKLSSLEGLCLNVFNMLDFYTDWKILGNKIIKLPDSMWVYSYKMDEGVKSGVSVREEFNENTDEIDRLKTLLDEHVREEMKNMIIRKLFVSRLKEFEKKMSNKEHLEILNGSLIRKLWKLLEDETVSTQIMNRAKAKKFNMMKDDLVVDLYKDFIIRYSSLKNALFKTKYLIPKAGYSYLVLNFFAEKDKIDEAVKLVRESPEWLPFYLLQNRLINKIDVKKAKKKEKAVSCEIDYRNMDEVSTKTVHS